MEPSHAFFLIAAVLLFAVALGMVDAVKQLQSTEQFVALNAEGKNIVDQRCTVRSSDGKPFAFKSSVVQKRFPGTSCHIVGTGMGLVASMTECSRMNSRINPGTAGTHALDFRPVPDNACIISGLNKMTHRQLDAYDAHLMSIATGSDAIHTQTTASNALRTQTTALLRGVRAMIPNECKDATPETIAACTQAVNTHVMGQQQSTQTLRAIFAKLREVGGKRCAKVTESSDASIIDRCIKSLEADATSQPLQSIIAGLRVVGGRRCAEVTESSDASIINRCIQSLV